MGKCVARLVKHFAKLVKRFAKLAKPFTRLASVYLCIPVYTRVYLLVVFTRVFAYFLKCPRLEIYKKVYTNTCASLAKHYLYGLQGL